MKKLWEKIKESLYGILPWLILFGIPLILGAVIGLIRIWDDIPKILGGITDIGNGSLLYGAFLILFCLVGLINAVIALMMWFKAFTEWLERLDKKEKPHFLLWIIVIAVTVGWYALFKFIRLL